VFRRVLDTSGAITRRRNPRSLTNPRKRIKAKISGGSDDAAYAPFPNRRLWLGLPSARCHLMLLAIDSLSTSICSSLADQRSIEVWVYTSHLSTGNSVAANDFMVCRLIIVGAVSLRNKQTKMPATNPPSAKRRVFCMP
jgi:hypothetical protein